MRRDFRVKMDFSKIYQDARQNSWVFIDSTKIFYINQLADHVRKLFDIKKPFHFLSRYEDMYYFLPFEEDVRVLENNDMVLIVPGTGISNNCNAKTYEEETQNLQNDFTEPIECQKRENNTNSTKPSVSARSSVSEKSYTTDKSTVDYSIENPSVLYLDTVSLNSTLYKTALHTTTLNDTQDSKVTEDNFTEDNSITEDSMISTKRKRVRKRKQKKGADIVPESDVSIVESSGKKPKIIDSILVSSRKHIRFQGLDDETTSYNNGKNENNIQLTKQNSDLQNNQFASKDLAALLNLRQSSTPLTFVHRRMKREYKTEVINEMDTSMDTSEVKNQSDANLNYSKSTTESEKNKENSQLNGTTTDDKTVSFKVFKMGEDYTPQLSSVILAKLLSANDDGSQYTMKILHGKDQLQDPEGKFSLPKDEDINNEVDDIITLEKSKLLELTKVKAI